MSADRVETEPIIQSSDTFWKINIVFTSQLWIIHSSLSYQIKLNDVYSFKHFFESDTAQQKCTQNNIWTQDEPYASTRVFLLFLLHSICVSSAMLFDFIVFISYRWKFHSQKNVTRWVELIYQLICLPMVASGVLDCITKQVRNCYYSNIGERTDYKEETMYKNDW